MTDGRNTCAKIARKHNIPQWAVYQIVHAYRFNEELAHFQAAITAIGGVLPTYVESYAAFAEMYDHATADRITPKLKDTSDDSGTRKTTG